MAPLVTSPKAITVGKNGIRPASNSREATPAAGNSLTVVGKGDNELASVFKSDLTDIRNLVTCSICDQLLYEPWTLACGHTYCYSCLCNWFVTNKRKKTCPECRAKVKQMPSPNFLVKQMVEIFTKRGELMPSDESIDQHEKRRADEIADVDKDRNCAEGLFKGLFSPISRQLIYDGGDGVYRCPGCLLEHGGGPTCENCNLPIDAEYDLSDMDDDFDPEDLEDLEVDLDDADHDDGPNLLNRPAFFRHMREQLHNHHQAHLHRLHFHNNHHEYDSEDSDTDSSAPSVDDEDVEDDESLREFIVPDDDHHPQPPPGRHIDQSNQREPINISDDESDEGGAISNRRRRRNGRIHVASGRSSPSVVSVSSSSISEADAAMLQRAGWSPLDQENDSDVELQRQYPTFGSEEDNNTDESDTETIGNGASDNESGSSERSETPRFAYEYPPYAESSDGEDDMPEAERGMDRDGDTEMSVSPSTEHYRSPSMSTDAGYGFEMGSRASQSRSPSVVSEAYGFGVEDSGLSRTSGSVSEILDRYRSEPQDLGAANEIHEVDDDSSDSSIVPPPRRRQRRQHLNAAHIQQQYDPRISMIFAEHQQVRGAQDPRSNLAQLDDHLRQPPIVEPASRARRMPPYRVQRVDPLRSSRSPSATRVMSSSSRNGRIALQYPRRH